MIESLIDELVNRNIKVEVIEAGNLKVHCDISKIPADLLSEIRLRKNDLLQYLSTRNSSEDFGRIPLTQPGESYPLSPTQRRLWILSQFSESNVAYNIPGAYLFNGVVNVPALSASFNTIIERHESLRTVFRENEMGEARQYILSAAETKFKIQYKDLRHEVHPESTARDLVRLIYTKPFDLSSGPLIRAALYQVTDEQSIFAYAMHHIISDGWSMDVLLRQLLYCYDSINRGTGNSLPPLRIQYKDYAAWLQQQLSGDMLNAHKAWWLNQFRGELPVLALPAYRERPAVKTYKGAVIRSQIGPRAAMGIRSICRQEGSSLFMGMLALVNALFYRYTGMEDIIIGTPVAGREHIDLEDQIGFYVNTIALRTRFSGSNSFRELLQHTRQIMLEAYEHQVYPFDELVDALQLPRDVSRNPLFDVQLIVKNAEVSTGANHGSRKPAIDRYREVENTKSAFDMVLSFVESDAGLFTTIVYDRDVYDKAMVRQLAGHLEQLLISAIDHPDLPVQDLEFLSEAEKHRLLEQFNGKPGPFDWHKSVVELFEEQARHHPDTIAVSDGNKSLTYRQLSAYSDSLARYLLDSCQVQQDDLVGVMVDRGCRMIISILGLMKAGAAYVPVDPGYPAARRKFILHDSAIKVLLTEKQYIFDLDFYSGTIVAMDILPLDTASSIALPVIQPHQRAYVIYTSGSTGEPKGVMIEHGGLSNSIQAQLPVFDIKPNDRSLQFTSPSFDVSVFEIFITLLSGASLFMIPEKDKRDPVLLGKYITENKIDIASIPPAFVRLLDIKKIKSLKKLITGGESLLIDKVSSFLNHGSYYNAYGPTESSICASVFKIKKGEKITYRNIPIGTPIDNCRVYILDNRNGLVPAGVAGEIGIGGPGVARGYLNNPQLTAEKFIPDPYVPGGRIYKTGDIGRWLPNGNIEFLGRKDEQIKTNGYRIEPGEIEKVLQDFEGIDSSLVMQRANNQGLMELVAYFSSKKGINLFELRSYLRSNLPAYMIPGHYVELKEFPLTPNGKIDRIRLPEPTGTDLERAVAYAAPRNEMERRLANILEGILAKENIGIDDDYFELGGSSLKAMIVIKKVSYEMKKALPMKIIFEKKTVRLLAEYLMNADSLPPAISEKDRIAEPTVICDASYNQLSYFSEWNKNTDHIVVLSYEYPQLDLAVFSRAVKALIERHETLRTLFVTTGGSIKQQILKADEVYSKLTDPAIITSGGLEEVIKKEYTRTFDLFKGPLFLVNVYQTDSGAFHIILTLHHSITDGYSAGIIRSDLMALYSIMRVNNGTQLPPLPFQYRHFAGWQRNFVISPEGLRHKEYWLKRLEGMRTAMMLRSAGETIPAGIAQANILIAIIKGDFYEETDRFARKNGLTRTVLLMGVLAVLINRHFNTKDITLCMTVSGRNSKHYGGLDVTGLIGFFANLLLVRNSVDDEKPGLEYLRHLQDNFLDDLEHEAYPIQKLIHELPGVNPVEFLKHAAFYNYHNYDHVRNMETGRAEMEEEDVTPADMVMQPGLVLAVTEFKNCLRLKFIFNPTLFPYTERKEIKDRYLSLLRRMMQNPQAPVNSL